MVHRRSMFKVDAIILAAGIMFIIVGIMYFAFAKVIVINYRPILENGELEPSFPSSHTMMAICVYCAGIAIFSSLIPDSKMKWFPRIVLGAFLIIQVVSRVLSGYHWATDIIGAILLSTAFIAWFATGKDLIETAQEKSKK